jgi:predicted Fe-S protein YdhL (DUF1289 family)
MVKSPCVSICEDKNGICQGCGRTLYEIKMWTSFSNAVKLEVIEQSERRKAAIKIERIEDE